MRCPEVESIKTSTQVAQLLKIQSAFFFFLSQADYLSKSSLVSTIVFFWVLYQSLCTLCKSSSVNFQEICFNHHSTSVL